MFSNNYYIKNKKKFLTIMYFKKPTKKKNIIFLRAPYKNKLARLNILRLEYTSILSIKTKQKSIISNVFFLKNFDSLNVSSQKLKHTKTAVTFLNKHKSNFLLSSFN